MTEMQREVRANTIPQDAHRTGRRLVTFTVMSGGVSWKVKGILVYSLDVQSPQHLLEQVGRICGGPG